MTQNNYSNNLLVTPESPLPPALRTCHANALARTCEGAQPVEVTP